jgi:predicted nucleic acid-binding protein
VTLVVDASVVVALVADSGPDGDWAGEVCRGGGLIAPHLLGVEVISALRRRVLSGGLSRDAAALALTDACALPIQRYPFEPFADRVWRLRENLTPYDAWYVAIAEELGAPLATLDLRIASSPDIECEVLTPST